MFAKRHSRFLLILLPVVFALFSLLIPPETTAAQDPPQTYMSDPNHTFNRFELYGNSGAYWWVDGYCDPATLHPSGTFHPVNQELFLRYKSAAGPGFEQAIAPYCNANLPLADVHRDDLHFYYLRNGLKRKAVNPANAPEEAMPQAESYAPTALDLRGGNLYFADGFTIYRMKSDGSEAPAVVTSTGGTVTWIKSILYRNGETLGEALLWVQGGDLYRWRAGESADKLASGPFNDISVDYSGSYNAANLRTYLFVARESGLFRINAANGLSARIFTEAVHSVTTDTTLPASAADQKHIYLTHDVETCTSPTNCTYDSQIYRHPFVSPNYATWDQIAGDAAYGGGNNLRSDGTWLYFRTGPGIGVGTDIKRIRTDVDPFEVNITADYLEVVQAIQNLDIDVPLVADRPTYARGYAYLTESNIPVDHVSISARLYGTRDGEELGFVYSLNQPQIDENNDISERRSDIDRSFVFRLPETWVQTPAGGHSTLALRMEVDPDGLLPETGPDPTADNVVSLRNDATILHRIRPCLLAVPILATGAPSPGNQPAVLPATLARARSMLPVEGFQLHQPFLEALSASLSPEEVEELQGLFYMSDGGDPYDLDDGGDGQARFDLNFIAYTTDPPAGCIQTWYVGMVHQDAYWSNGGQTNIGTPSLLVKMQYGSGYPWVQPGAGQTLAHELGHIYYRKHINCGNFPPDQQNFDLLPFDPCRLSWPDDDGLKSHFGFDPLSYEQGKQAAIEPGVAKDIMSYQYPRWITTYFWQAVLNRVSPDPGPSAAAIDTNGAMLLVQGKVAADQTSADFERLAILPEGMAPAGPVSHSLAAQAALRNSDVVSYTLVLADAGGQPLNTFTVPAGEPFEASAGAQPSFTQYVPWNAQATRIQLKLEDALLGEYRLSSNPPAVTVGEPETGNPPDTVAVAWQMSDPDHDPLKATVQYSADGERWQTVVLETSRSDVLLSTRNLPGSSEGRLRVIVSDGAHTAVATSAPFSVPDHSPAVQLSGVAQAERLPFGTPLSLYGIAYDPEDGALGEMGWFLAGPMRRTGSGSDFTLRNMEPGAYSLTLRATDENDQTAETTVQFEVLPPEIPEGDLPLLDGYCGDAGYGDGTEIIVDDGRGDVPVSLLHAGEALYLCFNGLAAPGRLENEKYAGLQLDLDASGNDRGQFGDRGFFVNNVGELYETVRTTAGMAIDETPEPGFSAKVKGGPRSWSAELRIEDALLEGWDHAVRMALYLNAESPTANDHPWPAAAVDDNANHWAPAYFGDAPPPENRAPVADAGEPTLYRFNSAQTVFLDGGDSRDPDEDELSYEWSQVAGPPVALQDAETAMPSFEVQPVAKATELRFHLVVNDGSLDSPPAEVTVILAPSALAGQPHAIYLPLLLR